MVWGRSFAMGLARGQFHEHAGCASSATFCHILGQKTWRRSPGGAFVPHVRRPSADCFRGGLIYPPIDRSYKMEVEQTQADLVQQFVLLAGSARGRAAVELITHATSHPQLFAFSELLSSPHIGELKGTEHSSALDLLRLFAHGTWSDYKNNAQLLPQLDPQQELKLKQLTVMTLAETAKVLAYDLLMQQLDISNVRELEDLLINDCMYSGIVRGKLDQRRRCFEVQFAAGRDLRPGQLDNMIATLANWLSSSDNLLLTIQEKVKWAVSMNEQDRRHKKEVEDKTEEMQKSIKAEMEMRGQQDVVYSEAGALGALVMDYFDEDRSRPKRRWF